MISEEGQPCSESSARSRLQALPTEILHLVFDHLPLQDLLTTRKVCSFFAHVGIDHFGDEIPLVYHRNKFRALCEIAGHPEISKRMRSLFYRFDRCGWAPYEIWDSLRPDPQLKKEIVPLAKQLQEGHGAYGRKSKAAKVRIDGVPESDRQKGYRAFEALCRDTAEIYECGYDLACLRLLFQGCPKLREVTIASRVGSGRRLNAEFTAFSDTMTMLSEDWTRVYAGVHQVLTVTTAVQESGVALDSLTMFHVSQELFITSKPALRALVQPLRRLRMAIHTLQSPVDQGRNSAVINTAYVSNDNGNDDEDEGNDRESNDDNDNDDEDDGEDDDEDEDEDEDEGQHRDEEIDDNDDEDAGVRFRYLDSRDPQYVVRMTRLRELLAEARDLRVLSLELPLNHVRLTVCGGARLKHAIGDTIYPHLYELSISMCEIQAGHLVDLILRHKATLRRLYLGHLDLTAKGRTNWRTIFTKLSNKLPNLRGVRLTGDFLRNRCSDSSLHADPVMTRSYRDSLQNFVLYGGIWPKKPSSVRRPKRSEQLPEILNDYMESDDPARDYIPDEFDLYM